MLAVASVGLLVPMRSSAWAKPIGLGLADQLHGGPAAWGWPAIGQGEPDRGPSATPSPIGHKKTQRCIIFEIFQKRVLFL